MKGKFLDRDEVMDKFYFYGEEISNESFKPEWLRLDKALRPDGRYLTVETLSMEELIKSDIVKTEISHGHLIFLSSVHVESDRDIKTHFAVVNADEEGKFMRVLLNMVIENHLACLVNIESPHNSPGRIL